MRWLHQKKHLQVRLRLEYACVGWDPYHIKYISNLAKGKEDGKICQTRLLKI